MNIRIELSLRDFFLLGMSWNICRRGHVWPPIGVANEFLRCGVDDIWLPETDDRTSVVSWDLIELNDADYREAVRSVDSQATFDDLGQDNWRDWFHSAILLLEERERE